MKNSKSKKHVGPEGDVDPVKKIFSNAYDVTRVKLTEKDIQAINNNPEFRKKMEHAREAIQKINKHRKLNGLPPLGKDSFKE